MSWYENRSKMYSNWESCHRNIKVHVNSWFRPCPHISGNLGKRNFFLWIRLASTRIQCIFRLYPEIFGNALQSGNFLSDTNTYTFTPCSGYGAKEMAPKSELCACSFQDSLRQKNWALEQIRTNWNNKNNKNRIVIDQWPLNIVIYLASKRSPILNPWIWLGNRAHSSGAYFPMRTAVQNFPTGHRVMDYLWIFHLKFGSDC